MNLKYIVLLRFHSHPSYGTVITNLTKHLATSKFGLNLAKNLVRKKKLPLFQLEKIS